MLIVANGVYGLRQKSICECLNIPHDIIKYPYYKTFDLNEVCEYLKSHPEITHISCTHSETTSGIVNNVEALGNAIKKINPDYIFISDTISSIGAYNVNPDITKIDYIIGTSNKCL